MIHILKISFELFKGRKIVNKLAEEHRDGLSTKTFPSLRKSSVPSSGKYKLNQSIDISKLNTDEIAVRVSNKTIQASVRIARIDDAQISEGAHDSFRNKHVYY